MVDGGQIHKKETNSHHARNAGLRGEVGRDGKQRRPSENQQCCSQPEGITRCPHLQRRHRHQPPPQAQAQALGRPWIHCPQHLHGARGQVPLGHRCWGRPSLARPHGACHARERASVGAGVTGVGRQSIMMAAPARGRAAACGMERKGVGAVGGLGGVFQKTHPFEIRDSRSSTRPFHTACVTR